MPEVLHHTSRGGIEEDDEGFYSVTCQCGEFIGPAPDLEVMVDMAMEHAEYASLQDHARALDAQT